MTDQRKGREPRRILLILAGLLTAAVVLVSPARAAEGEKPTGSLKWIPEDAAFYSSMLRNAEQFQTMAKSRAWAKLKALPFVKMGLEKLKAELTGEEGKLAPLYKFYQEKENRQLVELLGEMVSDEVFMYGGESWAEFTELAQTVYGTAYLGSMVSGLTGKRGPEQQTEMARMVLHVLAEYKKALQIPDLIIGFKLKGTERAQAQLKRLRTLLDGLIKREPKLEGRVKWQKLAGGNFLTLTLDSKLVPWEKLPLKDLEEKEGEFDGVIKKLKEMKLTLSVGTRGKYLLIALGSSTSHLAKLGKGKLLADRKEFKPLAKFADQRLTGINYVSQAMNARTSTSKKDLEGLLDLAKYLLPLAEDLTEKQRMQIEKDVASLVKDLKPFLPTLGAMLSFQFLTDRGGESYFYDWSKYPQVDGSKPLSLLNHAGGTPLLVAVGRTNSSFTQAQYKLLVKWAKVGKGYFEEYAVPRMEEENREKYQKVAKVLYPALGRLDKTTRELLLPALADGQLGFVLDAKLKSKQWFNRMPASAKAMPMAEPALLVGVSDAEKLRKALTEYRSTVNDFLAKLRDVDERVPELKIPKLKKAKVKAGTLYFDPLDERLGIDRQIGPNAGLGEKVAVLSISHAHSKRLLASTPLQFKGGPLADSSRNLAQAGYLNWAATVDAARPWVRFAVRTTVPLAMRLDLQEPDEKATADKMTADILTQTGTVLDVLKVLRTYASATYHEDGAWVTHSEAVFRDLPAEKKD